MCLQTVDDKPMRSRGTGYKLLHCSPWGELRTGLIQGSHRQLNADKWLEDDRHRTLVTEGPETKTYPTGFHIFLTRRGVDKFRAALGWSTMTTGAVVRKVEFKEVVATGTQANVVVIVARKIKLCKE